MRKNLYVILDGYRFFFIDADAVRHETFRLDRSAQNGLDQILQKEKDFVRVHC